MYHLLRFLGHAFKVKRGWVLFALAAVAVFGMVQRANAGVYDFDTQEKAYSNPGSPSGCNIAYPGACTGIYQDSGSPWKYYLAYDTNGNYHLFRWQGETTCPDLAHPPLPGGGCAADEDQETVEHCQELRDETSGDGNDAVLEMEGSPTSCKGGCSFGPVGPHTSTTVGGITTTWADFGFTGALCTATPTNPAPATVALAPPKPTAPVCNPSASGQTFCTKQDGRQCYSASTGREICWTPGETGTKTDGAVAQKRNPGTTPATPPPPPPGETLTQQGTPVVATQNNVSSSSTTTTTTTTTNYSTEFGTNAGDTNQGQPSTGGGSEEIGGETGTVNGGECGAPFSVSGGDPVANRILTEIHDSNCAEKSKYTAEAEGLVASKAEAEGALEGTEASQKASIWGTGDAPATRYGVGVKTDIFGSESSSCPTMPEFELAGQTFALPAAFCEMGAWLRWLFILTAYIAAMRWIAK